MAKVQRAGKASDVSCPYTRSAGLQGSQRAWRARRGWWLPPKRRGRPFGKPQRKVKLLSSKTATPSTTLHFIPPTSQIPKGLKAPGLLLLPDLCPLFSRPLQRPSLADSPPTTHPRRQHVRRRRSLAQLRPVGPARRCWSAYSAEVAVVLLVSCSMLLNAAEDLLTIGFSAPQAIGTRHLSSRPLLCIQMLVLPLFQRSMRQI